MSSYVMRLIQFLFSSRIVRASKIVCKCLFLVWFFGFVWFFSIRIPYSRVFSFILWISLESLVKFLYFRWFFLFKSILNALRFFFWFRFLLVLYILLDSFLATCMTFSFIHSLFFKGHLCFLCNHIFLNYFYLYWLSGYWSCDIFDFNVNHAGKADSYITFIDEKMTKCKMTWKFK